LLTTPSAASTPQVESHHIERLPKERVGKQQRGAALQLGKQQRALLCDWKKGRRAPCSRETMVFVPDHNVTSSIHAETNRVFATTLKSPKKGAIFTLIQGLSLSNDRQPPYWAHVTKLCIVLRCLCGLRWTVPTRSRDQTTSQYRITLRIFYADQYTHHRANITHQFAVLQTTRQVP
jgi:hypothetical protein